MKGVEGYEQGKDQKTEFISIWYSNSHKYFCVIYIYLCFEQWNRLENCLNYDRIRLAHIRGFRINKKFKEIDEQATKEWYNASSEWDCSCGFCRNFLTLAHKRELPVLVLAILDNLHIPPEKATYVCGLYSDSKGGCCQFSYCIAGTIIGGNERVSARKSWGDVCCCHDPYPYGAPDFPKPHFDLEFSVVLPFLEVTYEK